MSSVAIIGAGKTGRGFIGRLLAEAGLPFLMIDKNEELVRSLADGVNIHSEDYPYLQFDAELLDPGYIPPAASVRPIVGFGNFLTRKLYTYNAASCVIAYMGWLYGYTDYGEAANDERIVTLLHRNYDATNRVLCEVFGYDPADQAEFAALSEKKFRDRTIVDTVGRNAREPQRKIAAGEPSLLHEHGEDTAVLAMTAAAMLLYDNDGEDACREMKAGCTAAQLPEKLSGLPGDSVLAQQSLAYYGEFEKTV